MIRRLNDQELTGLYESHLAGRGFQKVVDAGRLDATKLGDFGSLLLSPALEATKVELVFENMGAFPTARVDGLVQWVLDFSFQPGDPPLRASDLDDVWTLGFELDAAELRLVPSLAVVGVVCQWDVAIHFEQPGCVLFLDHDRYLDFWHRNSDSAKVLQVISGCLEEARRTFASEHSDFKGRSSGP